MENDLDAVEDELRGAVAGAILVDARLLRRVIKAHRALPRLSVSIPHERCYALHRDALLKITSEAELGPRAGALPETVILVARPTRQEMAKRSLAEIQVRLRRAAFHGQVHLRIEQRIAL
ncbi:MAG TPA: hypothetical protein VNO21_16245, partial [Polyangiaceae bacterium]|nr:hypothetical protein [Polyangiaceae bacterium]